MSTDKGDSGETGWLDDLGDVNGEPVPAIAADSSPFGERRTLASPDDSRRAGDPVPAQVGDHSWHRLARSFLALLAATVVLGLTCAVWLADRAFSQLDQTERTIVNLVNSVQESSQAFAVSQTSAQQAYISSQILLNKSEAQKNREQAQLDRSLIALTKAQEATQRADAQLAYAEARLDEAQALQTSESGGR